MKKKTLLSLPSGEIFNCNDEHIYNFFLTNIIKKKRYVEGVQVDTYVFNDNNREYVYDEIKKTLKRGLCVKHDKYGFGKLDGIISDGWIVAYGEYIKVYTSTEEIIKDIKFSFCND